MDVLLFDVCSLPFIGRTPLRRHQTMLQENDDDDDDDEEEGEHSGKRRLRNYKMLIFKINSKFSNLFLMSNLEVIFSACPTHQL
jgi:hypothetical protein